MDFVHPQQGVLQFWGPTSSTKRARDEATRFGLGVHHGAEELRLQLPRAEVPGELAPDDQAAYRGLELREVRERSLTLQVVWCHWFGGDLGANVHWSAVGFPLGLDAKVHWCPVG